MDADVAMMLADLDNGRRDIVTTADACRGSRREDREDLAVRREQQARRDRIKNGAPPGHPIAAKLAAWNTPETFESDSVAEQQTNFADGQAHRRQLDAQRRETEAQRGLREPQVQARQREPQWQQPSRGRTEDRQDARPPRPQGPNYVHDAPVNPLRQRPISPRAHGRVRYVNGVQQPVTSRLNVPRSIPASPAINIVAQTQTTTGASSVIRQPDRKFGRLSPVRLAPSEERHEQLSSIASPVRTSAHSAGTAPLGESAGSSSTRNEAAEIRPIQPSPSIAQSISDDSEAAIAKPDFSRHRAEALRLRCNKRVCTQGDDTVEWLERNPDAREIIVWVRRQVAKTVVKLAANPDGQEAREYCTKLDRQWLLDAAVDARKGRAIAHADPVVQDIVKLTKTVVDTDAVPQVTVTAASVEETASKGQDIASKAEESPAPAHVHERIDPPTGPIEASQSQPKASTTSGDHTNTTAPRGNLTVNFLNFEGHTAVANHFDVNAPVRLTLAIKPDDSSFDPLSLASAMESIARAMRAASGGVSFTFDA